MTVLGVNVKDTKQLAQAFVEEFGITYENLFDPRGEVAMAFRGFPPETVPATILIDRDGKVAAVYIDRVEKENLEASVGVLISEK